MKERHLFFIRLTSLLLAATLSRGTQAAVFYVDYAATGANDGMSWTDAYTDLQPAIAVAGGDDEIWVARGIYYPAVAGSARTSSFNLKTDLSLYGGFLPGMDSVTNRDWRVYQTILNGDLGRNDTANWGNRTDNAYSVVRMETTPRALLDGFVIRGGNANTDDNITFINCLGGGVYANWATGMQIANCVLTDNSASGSGGVYIRRSAGSLVTNCVFSGNRSTFADSDFGSGAIGGSADDGYHVDIVDCAFTGNTTAHRGGVLYSTHKLWSVELRNCLMVGNTAGGGGGALHLRNFPSAMVNCTLSGNDPEAVYVQGTNATAENCILWNNGNEVSLAQAGFDPWYSDIRNIAYEGTNGNINLDPQFLLSFSGSWSANPDYDASTGITRLNHSAARWEPDAWVGATVAPDRLQTPQFCVVSNSDTAVYVWGDASIGLSGVSFGLHDWHLSHTSPCIDAGNPASDWSSEPDYPNGLINMGFYGNTSEAATTTPPPLVPPAGIILSVW